MRAANAAPKGKFIILNAYMRKEESSKINNLSFYAWKLEKEEQFRSKASRRNNENQSRKQ